MTEAPIELPSTAVDLDVTLDIDAPRLARLLDVLGIDELLAPVSEEAGVG